MMKQTAVVRRKKVRARDKIKGWLMVMVVLLVISSMLLVDLSYIFM
jgi:hypothetical protein